MAIIFTTPFAIKAIGLHTCIKRLIDGPHPEDTPPAKTSGGILPVTMQDSAAAQRGAGPSGNGAADHVALDVARPPAGAHG